MDEVDQYINFAHIAQNSGNIRLGQGILSKLRGDLIEKRNILGQDQNKKNKI